METKYFEKEIKGTNYQFRLKGTSIVDIEKKNNTSIQVYCGTPTYEHCATLICEMLKSSMQRFSFNEALNLIDDMIDDGYSLETIYTDVILPTCVISGVFTERDSNELLEAITNKTQNKK